MTNKQILMAQQMVRKLDGIPIRISENRKTVQVTYDMDTYNLLLGTLTAVAEMQITEPQGLSGYHRDRVV